MQNKGDCLAIRHSTFDIRHSFLLALLLTIASTTGCASTGVTADPVYFPPPPASPRVVHLKSFNRLHDLMTVRRGLLDVFRGGAVSPYVGTPAGIAFRDGHLYICDTEKNVVHNWDLTTARATRIGSSGDTPLAKPVAVAVDNQGTVYVADTGRNEVIGFDAGGCSIRRFQPPDRGSYRPVALALYDRKLYVADIVAHRIDVFSTEDGGHLGGFGEVGSDTGRFYFPMGLATDASGNVFVSDMMNARVQVFDLQRNPLRSMGQPGNRFGDMGKPRHLAVGPDGTVFVTDVEFGHVHMFNTQGELLMLLGGPEDGNGGIPMPVGVAVATTLPDSLARLAPDDFEAAYYVFVTNSIGGKRISLFAVGSPL